MSLRKKVFLTLTVLTTVYLQGLNSANAEEFPKDKPFFIVPVENEEVAVDGFGDGLPKVKTYSHLYAKSAVFKTAQMRAIFQPENNNSFELHMQNQDDLCFGPDTSSRNGLKNGIIAVIKKDCKNTLNHIMEGEQIRVNNSNFCLTVKDGKLVQLQRIVYSPCNNSNSQRFKLVFGTDQTKKSYDYSCYRKPVLWFQDSSCKFNLPSGAKSMIYTGGAYATVTFHQADKTYDVGVKSPGDYSQRYLNPDEGMISIPDGTVKISVGPWNEKETTRFTIVTNK